VRVGEGEGGKAGTKREFRFEGSRQRKKRQGLPHSKTLSRDSVAVRQKI